jgi:hypothetical protein
MIDFLCILTRHIIIARDEQRAREKGLLLRLVRQIWAWPTTLLGGAPAVVGINEDLVLILSIALALERT